MGNYARHPYGIAIIGSVALHLVAAIALPSWSEADDTASEGRQEIVRLVDLPADVQNRLPTNAPPIDLSVFENNPNFNIDLSAVPQFDARGNSTGLEGGFEFSQGTNNLPVPGAPSFGQTNFSFVPISPPPINSTFSGFAPPPPSVINGFLPPPPNVPNSANTTIFGEETLTTPNFVSGDGNKQVFSVNPGMPQPSLSLLERQRQLEEEAAIALSPRNSSPTDPSISFSAELLQPRDLSSPSNPAALLPRSQSSANTDQTAANTATVTRSITGNYPRGACSSQASGTASYNVVVTPSGVPSQWSLNGSSGSNALDNQASNDIRNARFDGNNRNYLVNVSYRYQPSFCAAFQQPAPSNSTPPSPTPAQPKPTPQNSTNNGSGDRQTTEIPVTQPATPKPAAPTPAPAPAPKPTPIETQPITPITPAPPPQPQPTINIPAEPLRVNSESSSETPPSDTPE
ncbi:hypothetical protein NIES208_17835 [[Limnothrix rosea] IAM M-220]|nr:hypothetical protein NIES208_17835 [[Limnothrix rosea] IAM M-220]